MSAKVLNNTAVTIFWTPVNLSVVEQYTVHYITVGGVNGTITFSASASSGVVSGLQEGRQYQFGVTVTLNVSGELFSGLPNFTQATTILSESHTCIKITSCYLLNTVPVVLPSSSESTLSTTEISQAPTESNSSGAFMNYCHDKE